MLLFWMQLLRQAGTLLMQREVPESVNLHAAQVRLYYWRHMIEA